MGKYHRYDRNTEIWHVQDASSIKMFSQCNINNGCMAHFPCFYYLWKVQNAFQGQELLGWHVSNSIPFNYHQMDNQRNYLF